MVLLFKWHFFIDTLFENMIQKSRIKFQLKSNFWHFLEMLEIMLQHFWKMLEIHCIKNARNQKSTFDLRWAYVVKYKPTFWSKNSALLKMLIYTSPVSGQKLAFPTNIPLFFHKHILIYINIWFFFISKNNFSPIIWKYVVKMLLFKNHVQKL